MLQGSSSSRAFSWWFALLVFAIGCTPKTDDAPPPPQYVAGDVVRVDTVERVIVLRTGPSHGKELEVSIPADAQLEYGAQSIALKEIVAGDHAIIRLESTSGTQRVAEIVRIARSTTR